jgi:hypothetical protein
VGVATDHVEAVIGRFAYYANGLSLNVMRRAGETPNGLIDALVVRAIQHAGDLGLYAVSLNFAGFAHVTAADGRLALPQRLARALLRVPRLGVSAVASAVHVLPFGLVGPAAWRLSPAQARLIGARA